MKKYLPKLVQDDLWLEPYSGVISDRMIIAERKEKELTRNNFVQHTLYEVIRPPIDLLADPVNVLCYGDNNGSIDLTINGGIKPYDILWNTSDSYNFV